MPRPFSTFPRGAPGAGLLLIRIAACLTLGADVLTALHGGSSLALSFYYTALGFLGLLLLVGFWTSLAGSLLALAALGNAIAQSQDRWCWLIFGALAAALALLGPGAWSVDARRYGWRRLEIPDRKRDDASLS